MTRSTASPDRGAARRGWSELGPRVASALAMALVALGTAWIGGALFAAFWLLAGLAVFWEWLGLANVGRAPALLATGLVSLAATSVLGATAHPAWALSAVLAGAASAATLCDRSRRLFVAGGVCYAGALAAAAPLLRQSEPFGLAAILWLFAVVWGTDTMAFFGGRLIGGPKLAPRLSPSKTWSGFGVGVGAGALLGLGVAPASGCPVCVLVLGLLGGAIAQAGDLFESALKRRFGVKDAGSLIPGHGGFMDRLDGFIATSLSAALLGLWRFGPASAGAGLFRW